MTSPPDNVVVPWALWTGVVYALGAAWLILLSEVIVGDGLAFAGFALAVLGMIRILWGYRLQRRRRCA